MKNLQYLVATTFLTASCGDVGVPKPPEGYELVDKSLYPTFQAMEGGFSEDIRPEVEDIDFYTGAFSCLEDNPQGYAQCNKQGEGYVALCAEWRVFQYEDQIGIKGHESIHKIDSKVDFDFDTFNEHFAAWYTDEAYGDPTTNLFKSTMYWSLYQQEDWKDMTYGATAYEGNEDIRGIEEVAFMGGLHIAFAHPSHPFATKNEEVLLNLLSPDLIDDLYQFIEPSMLDGRTATSVVDTSFGIVLYQNGAAVELRAQ